MLWTRELPVEPKALSALRLEASVFLLASGVDAELDDAALLLSELVANAATHGAKPATAIVDVSPDRVRIAVEDASPVGPEWPDEHASPSSGRGLRIVEALSSDRGVEWRAPTGKTVWCELRRGTGQRIKP